MAVKSKSADDFKKSKSSVTLLPYGQCIVHERWKGHQITKLMTKDFQVNFDDGNDLIDFQPSSHQFVSLLSESDIVMGVDEVRKKLARLYKWTVEGKSGERQPIAIYHSTDLTRPYFYSIQNLCVLDFSIPLIPVERLEQIPQLMESFMTSSRVSNPLRVDRIPDYNIDKESLLALMNVPNLDEKSARKLLEEFGCLRGVAVAREDELAQVVGPRLARGLHSFLRTKSSV